MFKGYRKRKLDWNRLKTSWNLHWTCDTSNVPSSKAPSKNIISLACIPERIHLTILKKSKCSRNIIKFLLNRNWRCGKMFFTDVKLWKCHFLARIITSDKVFIFYTLLNENSWNVKSSSVNNQGEIIKGTLRSVDSPSFFQLFLKKIFLFLYWPSFIVLLFLLFEISGSISGSIFMVIVCIPICDVAFEICHSFLIKPFS